ncbi:hypothetical protein JZ751_012648, partial [Albula glossodonta]
MGVTEENRGAIQEAYAPRHQRTSPTEPEAPQEQFFSPYQYPYNPYSSFYGQQRRRSSLYLLLPFILARLRTSTTTTAPLLNWSRLSRAWVSSLPRLQRAANLLGSSPPQPRSSPLRIWRTEISVSLRRAQSPPLHSPDVMYSASCTGSDELERSERSASFEGFRGFRGFGRYPSFSPYGGSRSSLFPLLLPFLLSRFLPTAAPLSAPE